MRLIHSRSHLFGYRFHRETRIKIWRMFWHCLFGNFHDIQYAEKVYDLLLGQFRFVPFDEFLYVGREPAKTHRTAENDHVARCYGRDIYSPHALYGKLFPQFITDYLPHLSG